MYHNFKKIFLVIIKVFTCIFYLPLTKVQFPLCVLQFQKIVQLLANSRLHQSMKIPSLPLEIFYSKLETIFWPQGPSLGLLSDLTCKRTLGLLNNFTKISMKAQKQYFQCFNFLMKKNYLWQATYYSFFTLSRISEFLLGSILYKYF